MKTKIVKKKKKYIFIGMALSSQIVILITDTCIFVVTNWYIMY